MTAKGEKRIDWTEEEVAELTRLLEKGYSVESIARLINRPLGGVDCKRKALGLRDLTKRPRKAGGRYYQSSPVSGARGPTVPRNCMCCERVFQSEGIHNRLCGDCRRRDEGISSHAVATGRPSRGVRV